MGMNYWISRGHKFFRHTARSRWTLVAIGVLMYFAFGVISAAIAVVVTPIRNELSLSYSQIGIILGSWQLMYIVVALPLGLMIDRVGLQRSLLFGTVAISLSAILRAYSVDFTSMLLAVGLFGIGGPVISVGLPKLVATLFDTGKRMLPTAIYITGSTLGAAFALAATNTFVVPFTGSWRSAYLCYGLFGLAIAFAWWLLGRNPAGSPTTEPKTASHATSTDPFYLYLSVLREKPVLLVALVGLAGLMLDHGLNNWLPQILEAKRYSAVETGYLATIPRIGGIFGGLLAAQLASLTGSRHGTAAIVLIGCSIGLALVGLFADVWQLSLALLSLGVTAAAVMPIMMAVLMELPQIGAQRMGAAAGVYFGIGEIGGFSGPALLGLLYDATGTFTWGITALALVAVAALLPLWMLRTTLLRRGERV